MAFSSPNNAATFECSLGGSAFQTCTNPVTHLSLTDDTHVFSVRAVNAVGTRDPTPAAWIWLVDTVAPDTNLVSAPSGTLDLRNVAVSFTSNDSGAGFECRLNSGAFAACTSPVDYSGLTDGAHVVVVRAVDLAGNVDASPAGATFAVDAPPETSIVAGPAGSIATSTASFVLGSSTPSDTFECSLNGAPYVVCSSPLQVIGIAPGTHALLVRAVDLGGERDPTPASSTWTVVQLAATPSAFAANVRKAGVKPGDHRATLTWRRPRDADFHHVEIVRVPGKKKKARSLVYKGNKIAFVDKGLKNGVQYTWFVYAADKKGNRSGGVNLKATSPVQVRLGKKLRVVPQAPIRFSWNPRKKARFYNVQLFRGKRKVLSSWPVKSTVSLSGPWSWEGRKRKLVAGNYEWFVWPGFGKRADSNFGKLIGSGKLVVKNPKAAGAKKKKKK